MNNNLAYTQPEQLIHGAFAAVNDAVAMCVYQAAMICLGLQNLRVALLLTLADATTNSLRLQVSSGESQRCSSREQPWLRPISIAFGISNNPIAPTDAKGIV